MRCMEKDFESFRLLMLNRAASIIPAWTDMEAEDSGIILVELLAFVAEHIQAITKMLSNC